MHAIGNPSFFNDYPLQIIRMIGIAVNDFMRIIDMGYSWSSVCIGTAARAEKSLDVRTIGVRHNSTSKVSQPYG